jgi:MFS family permease
MFDTGGTAMILGAIMLGLSIHAFMYAPQPAIMAEMFPTRMRYSGVSLGYQATAIIAGSWAPLIGTALLREYDSWVPIAFYILFAGAVSLGAALYMRESRGVSLLAVDEEDIRRLAGAHRQ